MSRGRVQTGNVIEALIAGSMLSVILYFCRVIGGGTTRFSFLLWNLFLAWLPLLFAYFLRRRLHNERWLSWPSIALTALWLGFLPNSFYLVTDFIHLRNTGEVSILFDAVMLMSFAWNGMVLGFLSTLMIHRQLKLRLRAIRTWAVILGVFLLCSFAIYLGRYLSWNTWDIVLNPLGILFDLSDRIVSPASFPNTFTTTAVFFVFISVTYFMTHRLIEAVRPAEEF